MKFVFASGARPLDGYTIKRGIGRGGFGEVYFATSDGGKEVALKHVERNLEVELRGVSQCLNLKHVNLIDLFDVRYDEQGEAWVVMEYVGGASLKEVLDRNPNGLPLDQVNHWFRGIAAGVAYLHDHGIVHRDLKPGNVFDDGGVVKLGDYGLSKFISCSRKSGQTESVGTFHYMAPEIGKGIYGKEIDIYALAIVLYEMISGRVPFEGESSQEIIMKHLTADPDLSGIPQPYRAVIQRGMQKDPDKRFRSVAEMVAALHSPAVTKPGHGDNGKAPKGEPIYIGADDEGIFFGPLVENKPGQFVTAEVVRHGANGAALPASVPEEPIARAATHAWSRFANWWNHSPIGTPLKIGILAVVAILAIVNGEWLLPTAVVLGCVYLVYLGIRMLVRAGSAPAARPSPAPAATPAYLPRSPGWHPISAEAAGREQLRMRTGADRISELTGSMLGAAAIAAVLTVIMTAVGGEALDDSANPMAGPVWLWLTTTLGSWMVLAAGKAFENNSGEAIKRRFFMVVLGLAFAALAFATSNYLMVDMHDGFVGRSIIEPQDSQHMFASDGSPKLAGFLAYFGAVFLTVGWWKQTDPLRSSRLRIAPILTTIVAAWFWSLLWPFPQPWGFMTVAAISIAVQLSSPWLSPKERTAYLHRRQQALVQGTV